MKRLNTFFISLLLICFFSFENFSQVPGSGQLPINPTSIPQFVDRLPHFAGERVNVKAGGNIYVKMVPHDQIALSKGTVVNGGVIGAYIDPSINPSEGAAHLWVYRISTDGVNFTPPHWPGFTIDAMRGHQVNVEYSNQLYDETYEDVGLVADQTLHWANPLNAPHNTTAPYEGPVPLVTHLHGGEVKSESDGGPNSWFTPGYAIKGPSWGEGSASDVVDQYYEYENTQEEATLWFHDHALGATRLNVYAGLSAFYLLRGPEEETAQLPGWSGDNMVQEIDRVTGLPVDSPYLPEIELAIQDRMFDTNGQLYFPNLPSSMHHPWWTPEFVGDVVTVNGKTWPYLSVAPRKYRFRILNGSNARFYELWLENLATEVLGPVIYQIGTDGGLLDAPVPINPNLKGKLLLGPGERADIIIDFSGIAPGTAITMRNSGRAPYPKGAPPSATTLGRIMQFVVNGQLSGSDNSQMPPNLRTEPLVPLTNFAGGILAPVTLTRQLTLNEVMAMTGPYEALVNNTKWDGNGIGVSGLGTTETPTEGTTEIWKITNLTGDAHPIHLHLVQFQLVSRQNFNVNKYTKAYNALFPGSAMIDPMTGLPHPPGVFIGGYGPPKPYDFYWNGGAGWLGGNPNITPYLQDVPVPPMPNERGWKDTFIMYPGQVTTLVVRFAPTDFPTSEPADNLLFNFDPSEGPGYVWHCHIIDHEDNEMMRPFTVNPNLSRALSKMGSDVFAANYELGQNYPNPFNPTTTIDFTLPDNAFVSLKIYNIIGAEVGTLINQDVPKGKHTVVFDATGLASGMYTYSLSAGNFRETKKMLLLK